MKTYPITIELNGEARNTDVSATETLLDVLRNKFDAVEVKNGCEQGDCGACTVTLDGKAVNACLVLALQASGKAVTTVKGIGSQTSPHALQRAFVEQGAIQCGYCTAGMITAAKALLDEKSTATTAEIRQAISGNLCRCTGYKKIVAAIESVAKKEPATHKR